MTSKFVVIRRFPAIVHAELAKGALQAYGIPAVINGGLMSPQGVRPGQHWTIDLMVREDQAEAALEILGPEEQFSD